MAQQTGERFIAQRGDHAGQEIEVIRTTDRSVMFRATSPGNNQGKGKIDQSRVHTLPREAFDRRYAPKDQLVAPHLTNGGGRAFRRQYTPPPVEDQPLDSTGFATPPLLRSPLDSPAPPPISVEVTTVTPDQARAWLERGGINRQLNQGRVTFYASQMGRGEWHLTGDSIKLDADGMLRDGQHRLQAIVESHTPVQTLVVRGVTAAAFDVIDTGKGRSAADVLHMHGYRNIQGLAAASRTLILIERYGRMAVGTTLIQRAITHERILAYVEQHEDTLTEALRNCYRLRDYGLMVSVGLYGAAFTLFLRKDADAAHAFMDSVSNGANLDKDDPILRLRSRIYNNKFGYGTLEERETTVAVAIKAWNLWRKGEKVGFLTWRTNEPFPGVE